MPDWRKHRDKALAKVHAHTSVPAVYLTHAAGNPVRLDVQVHVQLQRHENEFTFVSTPGLLDLTPRLEFQMSQLPTSKVMQNACVFVSATEVYFTGPSRPARDGYMEVEVTEADADTIARFTAPFIADGFGPEWDGIYP